MNIRILGIKLMESILVRYLNITKNLCQNMKKVLKQILMGINIFQLNLYLWNIQNIIEFLKTKRN